MTVRRRKPSPRNARARPAAAGTRAKTAAKKVPPPGRRPKQSPAAREPSEIIERLRDQVRIGRAALRGERASVEQWRIAAGRVPALEDVIADLRRELGPQRPLFPVLESAANAKEPWLPPVVEAHLTALNEQASETAASVFATTGVAIDGAGILSPARGTAALTQFHATLLATWSDFRFFPRAWHNLRSVAYLEGDTSFVLRRPWAGVVPPGSGRAATIDTLLVYDIAANGGAEQITRFKLYYDAASVLAQLRQGSAQASLL